MAPRTAKPKSAPKPAEAQQEPQEQQKQQEQQEQSPSGDQAATPPGGPTADFVQAPGFTMNADGDVVDENGLGLPPVLEGDDGSAMVLKALVMACLPAAAPPLEATATATLAAQATPAPSDAGELVGSQAVADVLAERARQVAKGYTAEHDRQHRPEALVKAGISLAMLGADLPRPLYYWPFSEAPNIQRQPREQLVRAAAVLLAAIEAHDARVEP